MNWFDVFILIALAWLLVSVLAAILFVRWLDHRDAKAFAREWTGGEGRGKNQAR